MRWRVQLGINSTSDGWKFPNITSTINPKLYEQHRMITCLLLA